MSLFSKSPKVSAVFDIGNGSIGVALVAFSKNARDNKPATVLYTYREPITFVTNLTPQNLSSSLLRLLKSVSDHLRKNGFSYVPRDILGQRIVHDVYCVFAAPWCYSSTMILNAKKRRPTPITQSFLDEMLARSPLSAESIGPADSARTVIEKKVINISLNGYDVNEPVGKKAIDIEMTAFSSSVPGILLKKIEEVIAGSFHFKKMSFFSYALASWAATRSLFPAVSDFLFFDVSGEATEVSIMVKGVLRGVESFPYGRAAIIRSVVAEMAVSPDVALSFLTLTLSGKAEAGIAARIKEISQKSVGSWLAECKTALRKLQQMYSLPRAVFMTVDDDVAELFSNAIRSTHSPELNVPHDEFDLVYLSGEAFRGRNRYLTIHVPDPFLSLESLFLAENIGKSF